jgi:hypothetical protein
MCWRHGCLSKFTKFILLVDAVYLSIEVSVIGLKTILFFSSYFTGGNCQKVVFCVGDKPLSTRVVVDSDPLGGT